MPSARSPRRSRDRRSPRPLEVGERHPPVVAEVQVSEQIKVGVMTDVGFTHDPQLVDTAKVFTDWCNAAGGINGRKLVADIHDTQLTQSVQAMTAACDADFVLTGGSAALDGLAVRSRLSCLLPDFPAQTVMPQNVGSDLQA